ncbi:NAD-dependent protein deacylase [Brevibacillus borstelensis]|uniref:NAD-dependent deacylase n=1 Tax=Brevibacillus borstelensis TaxID=45462 RepID=UPI0030C2EF53
MNELIKLLQEARHLVVFTGAGMSTESGLPDFRSARTGLWQGKDPARLASTDALFNNREEFVAFYRMRLERLYACQPHQGHLILAEWERRGHIKGIITQNVDGFHQRAGSRCVAELHGTLTTLTCIRCTKKYEAARYLEERGTVCECGGFLRPSVVLFGESLPESAFAQAVEWTERADLFLVLGSSLAVSPANWFPEQAKARGAKLVIVNRDATHLDDIADLLIQDELIGDVLRKAEIEWKH